VATRSRGHARERAAGSKRRKRKPDINQEEEEILKRAQSYMLFEAGRPMFWTVAGIREEKGDDGSRRWNIAVNLRYPTGFEGYLGDLLYDGTRFTELTDLEVMRERGRQIAADPEGIRQWNEYRAATRRRPSTEAEDVGSLLQRRSHGGEISVSSSINGRRVRIL
jgi:hypothetical protein